MFNKINGIYLIFNFQSNGIMIMDGSWINERVGWIY